MNDDAEGDSVDSLICACGSSMLMRLSDAHEVLLCSEREGIARAY